MKVGYAIVAADAALAGGNAITLFSVAVNKAGGETFNIIAYTDAAQTTTAELAELTFTTDDAIFNFPYGVTLPYGGYVTGNTNSATVGYVKA